MVTSKTSAIIFEGGQAEGAVTQQMQPVRRAACLDLIELLLSLAGYYDKVILATNFPDLAARALELGAEVMTTPSGADFHFGRCLQQIASGLQSKAALYLSGAGTPLLSREEFIAIAEDLATQDKLVITNNVQSSDIAGWTPLAAIQQIEPPTMDNSLGYLLRKDAGLPRKLLPHSVGVHYDIDTPADILMLKLVKLGSKRVRAALEDIPWEMTAYEQLWRLFSERNGNIPRIWMSGRIGGPIIQHINTHVVARLRVVSEERGMKSMGQENIVCSFVGSYIEEVGIEAFFRYLEKSSDAALIDTRPLFAHFRLQPSDNDRFSSDLLQWQDIQEPWVRQFTKAAAEAKIPVLLGGHTLILGDMWTLVEALRASRN